MARNGEALREKNAAESEASVAMVSSTATRAYVCPTIAPQKLDLAVRGATSMGFDTDATAPANTMQP